MQTAPTIPPQGLLLACLLATLAVAGGAAETCTDAGRAARGHITALALGVTAFERDVGRFPTPEEGLTVLVKEPQGAAAARWKGPYLQPPEVPVDPWGNAYGYVARPEDAERPFSVYSCGPDGGSASVGDDADDVGLWAPAPPPAEAPAAAPSGAVMARLLRGPLPIAVVLTAAVALLRRHAARVARQPQPHVDGYVCRRHRGPRRLATVRAQSQVQNNTKA